MLSKVANKLFLISCLIFTACFQIGCSDEQESEVELVTISGTLSSSSAQQKVQSQKNVAQAIVDYQIYCVTFLNPPTSAIAEISQEGAFSLAMPAGVAFGCFVNNASTGSPVATMAIAGDDDSFGSSSSASIQLVGNVSLGILQLDLERGEVLIPRSVIEPVLQPRAEVSLDIDEIHNSSYRMSCLPTGNSALDQACNEGIASDDGDNEIFFRIMKATRNSEEIRGIGVWESQQAFNDCGAIDLTDQTISDLGVDEGIQFLQGGVIGGSTFSTGTNCPLRNSSVAADHENLSLYYAAGELVPDGSGYTLQARGARLANPGCLIEDNTTVHFSGDSADRLIGQFWANESHIDLNNGLGDCSHLQQSVNLSFLIEFVKQ